MASIYVPESVEMLCHRATWPLYTNKCQSRDFSGFSMSYPKVKFFCTLYDEVLTLRDFLNDLVQEVLNSAKYFDLKVCSGPTRGPKKSDLRPLYFALRVRSVQKFCLLNLILTGP